jgi:predicted alpha/beta hydrolase family esterase
VSKSFDHKGTAKAPVKPQVLLLPGWHDSGPGHWQSHWQAAHGYVRVEQHNWDRPLRGDWLSQLEETVLQFPQSVLVAHSLGCIQVAAWAAHSRNCHRVKAALLVAPCDAERSEMQNILHSWHPIVRDRLPFPSIVVTSRNDPYCSFMRASALAQAWGSSMVDGGMSGHINSDSRLGNWPQGLALLQQLL